MKKKLTEYYKMECYNCDGDGGCEYSHWVDDLMVDGGQREVVEVKTCHICLGDGNLVCIPAPDAEQHDKLDEAKDVVIEAADACRLRGHGRNDALRLSFALAALKKVQNETD